MRHVLTLIFLWAHALSAQTGFSTVNLYTTQNGLSNNNVSCIVQDIRGFLWLGTREGLNRFDGYRFKSFFTEKTPAAGLADNFITDLLEYQPGRLLVATANGLSVLDTYSGNFENDKIQFAPLFAGSGILVESLFKDKSGKIWINHSGELDVLDSNLNFIHRFTDLPWAKSLKGITLRPHSLMQDKQQRLWLPGDTTGIHLVDLDAQKVYNSNNNPFNYPFLTKNFIRSLLLDETSNTLWYGPWGQGLMKYNFISKSSEQIFFGAEKRGEEQTINAIRFTGSGKILCLASYKIFEVDTSNHLYSPVNVYAGEPFNPAPEIVFHSVFHSRDNQYWLGSSVGLWQLKNEESFLRKISIDLKQENTIQPVNTDITLSPGGKLYLGFSPGGLVEIDLNRRDYHIYNFKEKTPVQITRVRADAGGLIWVGTSAGLISLIR